MVLAMLRAARSALRFAASRVALDTSSPTYGHMLSAGTSDILSLIVLGLSLSYGVQMIGKEDYESEIE